jgi:hypothetical protein
MRVRGRARADLERPLAIFAEVGAGDTARVPEIGKPQS